MHILSKYKHAAEVKTNIYILHIYIFINILSICAYLHFI